MKLFYNPKCNTCRTSLKMLQEKGEEVDVIKYLEDVPTVEDIKELVSMLGISPIDLIRKKESIWKEEFADKELGDEEIILCMAEYPILIERPIFINGSKAIIGRPSERVLEIL